MDNKICESKEIEAGVSTVYWRQGDDWHGWKSDTMFNLYCSLRASFQFYEHAKLLLPQGHTHNIVRAWNALPLRPLALSPVNSDVSFCSQLKDPLLKPCLTVPTRAAMLYNSILCEQGHQSGAQSWCSSRLAQKSCCTHV